MKRPLALVTGAPGWLGSRLVRSLRDGLPDCPSLKHDEGRSIRCLVFRGADPAAVAALGRGFEIVEGDLTEPASLAPFFAGARDATLFHSAGVIHPTRGVRELFDVNAKGTRALLDAAVAAGVRRFVHVSSNSPIGTNPTPDHLFDEGAPYRPYMNYGKSKKLAEDAVNEARAKGGIETVIIRPPWFYGPGQPPRQSLFFSMIKKGRAPIVGGGENRRSMAYVDNICQGLLLCEQVERANGRTYWIADRRPYSMNEIIDTFERVMEREFGVKVDHKRMRLPGLVSSAAYVADAMLQGLGLYHPKIHVLSEMDKTIACSIAQAEAELGYSPTVDLEEGARRSFQWMRDNGVPL